MKRAISRLYTGDTLAQGLEFSWSFFLLPGSVSKVCQLYMLYTQCFPRVELEHQWTSFSATPHVHCPYLRPILHTNLNVQLMSLAVKLTVWKRQLGKKHCILLIVFVRFLSILMSASKNTSCPKVGLQEKRSKEKERKEKKRREKRRRKEREPITWSGKVGK